MTTTASFGASNTALLKDPNVKIGSFQGLRSSNYLALSRRTVPAYWVSSSNRSLIRAVSTVRFELFLSVLGFGFFVWVYCSGWIASGKRKENGIIFCQIERK